MDIETLTRRAATVLYTFDRALWCDHGVEVAEGFFNIYNNHTGQSRVVVYNPESGFCFKRADSDNEIASDAGRWLGTVNWFGQCLSVRLPHFFYLEDEGIMAQEYVIGAPCDCDASPFCKHTRELSSITGYRDTHRGNWKISGDEVIIFDYES